MERWFNNKQNYSPRATRHKILIISTTRTSKWPSYPWYKLNPN